MPLVTSTLSYEAYELCCNRVSGKGIQFCKKRLRESFVFHFLVVVSLDSNNITMLLYIDEQVVRMDCLTVFV